MDGLKETAIPWEISYGPSSIEISIPNKEITGYRKVIAVLPLGPAGESTNAEANAALIVEAVNSYDALKHTAEAVDELVEAAEYAENVFRTCDEAGFREFKDNAAEVLRSALSKAKAS